MPGTDQRAGAGDEASTPARVRKRVVIVSRPLLLRSLGRHGDELAAGTFAVLLLTGVVSGPIPNGHRGLAVFAVSDC